MPPSYPHDDAAKGWEPDGKQGRNFDLAFAGRPVSSSSHQQRPTEAGGRHRGLGDQDLLGLVFSGALAVTDVFKGIKAAKKASREAAKTARAAREAEARAEEGRAGVGGATPDSAERRVAPLRAIIPRQGPSGFLTREGPKAPPWGGQRRPRRRGSNGFAPQDSGSVGVGVGSGSGSGSGWTSTGPGWTSRASVPVW